MSHDPVLRVVSPDAQVLFDNLQTSPLLAAGQITVVSLQAVAEGFDERWPQKAELVDEYALRAIGRRIGAEGYVRRVADTDYLVTQPAVMAQSGHALVFAALREIVGHFLGETPPDALCAHQVHQITPDGVFGERLDPDAVPEIPPVADPQDETAEPAAPGAWSTMTASDGRAFRVSCGFEPMFHLRPNEPIGYRLVRRVFWTATDVELLPAELAAMSAPDIERVDFTTIGRGVDRLSADGEAQQRPSLIVPIACATLDTLHGRQAIADMLRRARETVRHGLICEITNAEGYAQEELAVAVATVRPHCIFVAARLSAAAPMPVRPLRRAGFRGVALERPTGLNSEAEFIGWLNAGMAAAQPFTKTVMACRLRSMRETQLAASAGYSHATLFRAVAPAAAAATMTEAA